MFSGPTTGSIDFRAALNDDQFAAVTAGDGPQLVLAGAGSGKTRTLTYRVAWLLEQGIQPWQILLLTFTNKASKEMLERVEELTGTSARSFWGGTFHSFGQHLLRRHGTSIGIERNFTILDQNDAETLLGQVVREQDAAFLKDKDNPKPRVLADLFSFARNTQQTFAEVLKERAPWLFPRHDQLHSFLQAYTAAKRERQLTDYDDLLELPLQLLQTNKEVASHYQQRFQHILVDEYQDTNRIQSALIDLLADRHQIMAVGDDAQCIYTWRGAEFENIVSFPHRHPGTVVHKIEINYRSSPEILNFANHILTYEPDRSGFRKELQSVKESNQLPYFIPTVDTRHQAQLITRRIHRLVEEEGYALKDIAVLYRAHFQSMDLQMELSRQQTPFIITSGVRFFEQAHVRDFIAQLRIVANPEDAPAFLRLVQLLPRIGVRTAERLYSLAEKTAAKEGISFITSLQHSAVSSKVPADAADDWQSLTSTLIAVERSLVPPNQRTAKGTTGDLFSTAPTEETFTPSTPQEVVRLAIDGWYGDHLRTLHTNWRERLEDLQSLAEFASRFSSISDLLAELILLNAETTERAIDPDSETVRLTTVHQSKGLEFPIVFVIGLTDGQFPLRRAIDEGNLEEERRLFYVACTRAMDELYLFYPKILLSNGKAVPAEPSRFITEIPSDAFEVLRV